MKPTWAASVAQSGQGTLGPTSTPSPQRKKWEGIRPIAICPKKLLVWALPAGFPVGVTWPQQHSHNAATLSCRAFSTESFGIGVELSAPPILGFCLGSTARTLLHLYVPGATLENLSLHGLSLHPRVHLCSPLSSSFAHSPSLLRTLSHACITHGYSPLGQGAFLASVARCPGQLDSPRPI